MQVPSTIRSLLCCVVLCCVVAVTGLDLFAASEFQQKITRKTILFKPGQAHCEQEGCYFRIDGSLYAKRASYFLDEQGRADRMLWYLPEGPVEYTKADMRKDKRLATSHEFFEQTVTRKESVIFDGQKKMPIQKITKNPNLILVADPEVVYEF